MRSSSSSSYSNCSISIFLVLALPFHFTNATLFQFYNNCPYTVWAAGLVDKDIHTGEFGKGAGKELKPQEMWDADELESNNLDARIWGRTNCSFDESGRGSCLTGDCNGLLACKSEGAPPYTLVVDAHADPVFDRYLHINRFAISLVHGFNVPIEVSSNQDSRTCPGRCIRSNVTCTADINQQCPDELKAPGGCNDPCTVFKSDEYCCNSTSTSPTCGPTDFSRFFKDQCPNAYSRPGDDQSKKVYCRSIIPIWVMFCPDYDRWA